MPQFDKITFFNQLFWLLFFFSGFYLLLLHYFLPKLSSILKARQKMLKFYLGGVSNMFNERKELQTSLHTDCSVLLSQKNASTFLGSTLFFVEWVKNHLLNSFNTNFGKGLSNVEDRLYHQTVALHTLIDLKVSDVFLSKENPIT